jgi:hypothetical protein
LFLAWVFDAERAERGAECAEKGILRFAYVGRYGTRDALDLWRRMQRVDEVADGSIEAVRL